MPENAEIALTAEILIKYFKNKELNSFDFIGGRYTKKQADGFEEFSAALPLKVKNIDSKGKFLWFDLVDPNNKSKHWYIWNTFGLTGMWSLFEPNYVKAILTFSNNKTAYYSDLINYGTFKFSNSKDDLEKKLAQLGPDFLKEDDIDFYKIKKYKIPIIKILMDQKKSWQWIGKLFISRNFIQSQVVST